MKKETIVAQENQNFLLLSEKEQLNIFNSNRINCSQIVSGGKIYTWINDFIKKIATAKIKQSYSFRKLKAKNFIELQDGLNYKHVIKLSSEDFKYCNISLLINNNKILPEDIPHIIRRDCRLITNNNGAEYSLYGIISSILEYQNPNILSLINKNLPNLELCKEIFLNKNINDDFDKTKINAILNCIKRSELDEEEFKFLINISDITNFRSIMLEINNLVKKFSISEEEISKAFEWKTIKDILE